MKKILLFLLSTIIMVCSCGLLAACYVSKPDTMDHFVGTYELTSYTRRDKNAPEGTEATNMIEENGIVAYLIVNDNGTGYYVYKDNDTAVYARKIRIEYTYDDDDASKVEKIKYFDGTVTSEGDGYPNHGYEILGLTFGKKEKKLNYDMPAVFGRKYSQYVMYKKVSDKTDLSYASEKMGTNLVASEFEMNGLAIWTTQYYGFTEFYSTDNPYVYYIYDFHPADKKADLYYMLKSDETEKVENNLEITWTYSEDNYTLNMQIGTAVVQRYVSPNYINQYLMLNIPATEDTQEFSISLSAEKKTIREIITERVAGYQEYKTNLAQEQAAQQE